jgi:type I restriction enzyme S subunit
VYCLGRGVAGLSSDQIDMLYLRYYFDLIKDDLSNIANGTTFLQISKNDIENIKIPLPPINEQKRIVEKVEWLFAKIDEAKRLIEEVKESFELRRAAILDKAFKGQLGTNDSNEESMFKTSNELTEKDLIPKEEQPYEVPKNWVWIRLGSFLPPMETRDPAKLESENFLYVDIDSIDNNKFEIREPKIIEIKNAPSRAKRRIDKEDIIISLVRPYLRNVARVLYDDQRLVASTAFYVCRKNKVTNTNYLFYYLITSFVTSYLKVRMKGHNAPSVRNSDFLDLPVPIPPYEEQKRIAEKVDRFLSKLEEEEELVLQVEEHLNALKQSILNKAFRGELGTNDPTEESAIELLKKVLHIK